MQKMCVPRILFDTMVNDDIIREVLRRHGSQRTSIVGRRQPHLRSKAETQEFAKLEDPKRLSKMDQKPGQPEGKEGLEDKQSAVVADKIMTMLQQLWAQNQVMHQRNQRLETELAAQRSILNNLSSTVRDLQQMNLFATTANQSTAVPIETESNLLDRAMKEIQAKRINKLLDSTPFYGLATEDVSDWLEGFKRKCDQVQLPDDQRLIIATDLFKGTAKIWYDTQKESIEDWGTLETKMIDYFTLISGSDPFQLEQKLYNRIRRPNESAIDYTHNVLKLCARVNKQMEEKTRLKHLAKGLDAYAKAHMDVKDPQNTEEFLVALIKFDQWQLEGKIQQRKPPTISQPKATTPSQFHQSNIESTNGTQSYQATPSSTRNHLDRTVRYSGRTTNPGCWTCRSLEHYQYECPKNY